MDLAFDNVLDIGNYGSKAAGGKPLFTAAPLRIGTKWDIPGVAPATPEGREIEKLVKGIWVKEMDAFVKTREKELKAVLLHTETALMKTAEKMASAAGDAAPEAKKQKIAEWLQKEAPTAKMQLDNVLATIKSVAESKMTELWKKIAAAVDKKFKSDISSQKFLAAIHITGLSILIVAAAALTVAGAVLTAVGAPTGVGAVAGIGLAVGGIAALASASAKIYDVYSSNWPNHKTAGATLTKKAEALKTALEYEEKKLTKTSQGAKLGPKEKAKLVLGSTKGKRAELEVAVRSVATWTASMLQDVEKSGKAELALEQKLQELEKQIESEKDKKKAATLKKAADDCVKSIFDARVARENTRIYLKRYAAISEEATALLANDEKLTSSALGGFLSKLAGLAGSKEAETFIAVGKSSAMFLKALIKATA